MNPCVEGMRCIFLGSKCTRVLVFTHGAPIAKSRGSMPLGTDVKGKLDSSGDFEIRTKTLQELKKSTLRMFPQTRWPDLSSTYL